MRAIVLALTLGIAAAQTPAVDALLARLKAAPQLPLRKTVVKVDREIGFPSSVAMGADGLLYILQRGENSDPVMVVSTDGKVIRSWGRGMFAIPHAIRVDAEGSIWTVDAGNSKVMKFTPMGQKMLEIEVGGQPAGSGFNGTTDIAFGPQGRLFITDGYANARVVEYTSEGMRVKEWGAPGEARAQFHLPHAISCDGRILYVADRENGRVEKFDLDGRYLGQWGGFGKVFSVTAKDGAVWLGIQRNDQPNGAPGWFLKLDAVSGEILGVADSFSGQHTLNLTKDGEILAGARPDTVLWYRK